MRSLKGPTEAIHQALIVGNSLLLLLLVILFALTVCGCMSSASVVRDLFLVEFGVLNSTDEALRVGYYGK